MTIPVSGAMGITITAHANEIVIDAHPNLFDPRSHSSSVVPPNKSAPPPGTSTPSAPAQLTPRFQGTPKIATLDVQGAHLKAASGPLDVDVPAGAVSATDLAVAGGKMSLRVQEIAPASGSNAGGSGHYSFGTFLIQILDARGRLASSGLGKLATLRLHYGPGESALDLAHTIVVVNGSLPGLHARHRRI